MYPLFIGAKRDAWLLVINRDKHIPTPSIDRHLKGVLPVDIVVRQVVLITETLNGPFRERFFGKRQLRAELVDLSLGEGEAVKDVGGVGLLSSLTMWIAIVGYWI